MFMKRCPAEIDAARQPELACLQSLLFDEEQGPAGGQPGPGGGGAGGISRPARRPRPGERARGARGALGSCAPAHRPAVPPPSPAELAKMYKNEGNEYFKERDYRRAVVAYSEGLKKSCQEPELNAVLHTNRGAAHFHLGEEMCPIQPRTGMGRGPCGPKLLFLPILGFVFLFVIHHTKHLIHEK